MGAMIAAPLLLTVVSYADTTDLAHRVQIHLSAAAQPWLTKNARKLQKALPPDGVEVVFELEMNKKGGFTAVTRSLSSGQKSADRLARDLFRVLPPLPDPPPSVKRARRNVPCVVHLDIESRRSVAVGVACMPGRQLPQVALRDDAELSEPSASLFNGWKYEAAGDQTRARAAYRNAVEAAPTWDLAALAFGMNLARSGRLEEAIPVLERATQKRKPTREVRRYLKGQGPTEGTESEDDDLDGPAEADVSSCQRDEGEIFHHVRKCSRKLSRCISAEQKRAPTVSMPSALPVSFVVGPKGAVRQIAVNHRHYRDGKFPMCVEKALKAKLKPAGGSNCPVAFEIEVQGYAP